jgi:hypothetical protein
MKKRGITPTSRTYTTLINAYAGVNHSGIQSTYNPYIKPEARIMQRIVTIYNESQTLISQRVAELTQMQQMQQTPQPSDVGLAGSTKLRVQGDVLKSSEEVAQEKADIEADISLGPSNAYLKFLSRFGMWAQMDRIHLAMDITGPLAPDNITYSTLFSGLLSRLAEQTEKRYTPAIESGKVSRREVRNEEIGAAARSLWDSAIRQFYKDGTPSSDSSRRVDEEMALLAMQALLKGRPADERLVATLIPFIWDLPVPNAIVVASHSPGILNPVGRKANDDIPQSMRSIPAIPITLRAATSIVSMLNKAEKHVLSAHYAQHFLQLASLKPHIDFAFLRSSIHALSNTGQVQSIIAILDSYQPPTGTTGWPVYVYDNALTAARWSGDFIGALNVYRRLTHLPIGVEDGLPQAKWGKYTWSLPNGNPTDVKGVTWFKPAAQKPTPKTMSLFLKSALHNRLPSIMVTNCRKAWNIFINYSLEEFFVIPAKEVGGEEIRNYAMMAGGPGGYISGGLARAAEWRVALAGDVLRICELLEEGGVGRVPRVAETKAVMEGILKHWGARGGAVKQPKVKDTVVASAMSEEEGNVEVTKLIEPIEEED